MRREHVVLRRVCCRAAGADSAEDQLQIELPAALQKQLLDQYDAIHDDNKLLQVPRRPNVIQVMHWELGVWGCGAQLGRQGLVTAVQCAMSGTGLTAIGYPNTTSHAAAAAVDE